MFLPYADLDWAYFLEVCAMFKWVSLVFFCVVSATAFSLSNLNLVSNYTNTPANSPSYLASDRHSHDSSVKTISQGRYIGGGVASIFLGFGIGHAIQGRWEEKGWIHTLLQSSTIVVWFGSLAFTGFSLLEDASNYTFSGNSSAGIGLIAGTFIVLIGSRIWEMIDVWLLPDSIKIISQQHNFHKSSPLKHKTKMPYSVALHWQF